KFAIDDRNLADQATMKTESKRIFNRTFAVTAALNTFTLGVAGIALLTSLLTLGNSRLPQLAPLWAIGVTRQRLAFIELLKTMSVSRRSRRASGIVHRVVVRDGEPERFRRRGLWRAMDIVSPGRKIRRRARRLGQPAGLDGPRRRHQHQHAPLDRNFCARRR